MKKNVRVSAIVSVKADRVKESTVGIKNIRKRYKLLSKSSTPLLPPRTISRSKQNVDLTKVY